MCYAQSETKKYRNISYQLTDKHIIAVAFGDKKERQVNQ